MPIDYRIDAERRFVFATPRGTLTPDDLLGYIGEVWSRPEMKGYDEFVDMDSVERVEYGSSWRIREMAGAAVESDAPGIRTRLAIVDGKDPLYELGLKYRIFREFHSRSMREVQVFRNREEAMRWLEESRSPGPADRP